MLRKKKIALAISISCAFVPVLHANEDAKNTNEVSEEITQLKELSVTSTRSTRRIDNIPNTVTVTTQSEIEKKGARDLRDMFKNELDVSVRVAPTRFTAAGPSTGRANTEGINIRGLEGNRVMMLVDGIRLPDAFSFSSFSTGRGDFIDVNGLKAAEILRGPASTQFGSDGLAGAVTFRTLDPSDILKNDRNFSGFVRSGYSSIDNSISSTLSLAGREGDFEGLILGTYTNGHEVDNEGSNRSRNSERTASNPVDYDSKHLLGKVFYNLSDAQKIGLTLEKQNRNQDTEVYTARRYESLTRSTTLDLDGDDKLERERVSLEHRVNDINSPIIQRSETRAYWQKSNINQFSEELRSPQGVRTRDNEYESEVVGITTLFESNFSGFVNQRLTYGIDWSETDISAVRDGTVPPTNEVFPSKVFPDTEYSLLGAFVQSEIELASISVIPGLRFDKYKLKPDMSGYTGDKAVKLSDEAVTPRLGAVWRLTESFSPYGQWSKGFRAPTPDQVNNGFSNLIGPYAFYKTIGNANLEAETAETAETIELGARGKINNFKYSFAFFDSKYDDFISQEEVSGNMFDRNNPLLYQYINLEKRKLMVWKHELNGSLHLNG